MNNENNSTYPTTQHKLIIAEKPSLERMIVASIKDEQFEKKDGYYLGNKYIVTHVMGHLFEAYDIEDYTKDNGDWNLNILPFCPDNNIFSFKLKTKKGKSGKKETDPGIKKQFQIIKTLINSPNVSTIINGGDSDREGETLIRLIIRNTNESNKPVMRLWLPEQTPAQIRYGLNHLDEAAVHDNLANEGFSRLYQDWLYGINLTRYVTLKCKAPKGMPLRVGRVLAAIVNAIYERDMEISHFVPEKYFICISEEETDSSIIKLQANNKFNKDSYMEALEYCGRLNLAKAYVQSIEKKNVTLHPKKLFSTTTLQSAMNKLYDMPPNVCLTASQKLYESGYITYPRTDTEYMAESEMGRIEKVISVLNEKGYDLVLKENKTIFNSEKIVSHSAITPTYKVPDKLSETEDKVYNVILGRFAAVFCRESATADRTIIKISCADEFFSIKGDILKTKGFLKYDKTANLTERLLPDLKENQEIKIKFYPKETTTRPSAHFSVDAFLNYLEKPFSKNNKENNDEIDTVSDETISDDDEYKQLLDGVSIGTGATRSEILKKAIDNRYISLKKKFYYIEPLGIYLIETMKELNINISVDKTVEMNKVLKQVYNGEISIDESVNIAMADITAMFSSRDKEVKSMEESNLKIKSQYETDPIGSCPVCGGDVYERLYGYSCENNKKENGTCKFIIWKNDKFVQSITQKTLSLSQAKTLLKKQRCKVTGHRNSDNAPYDIFICLQIEDGKIKWTTKQIEDSEQEPLGKCPICKGNVFESAMGYSCENNKKESGTCKFTLWKNDKFVKAITKRQLSAANVKHLLAYQECLVTGYRKSDNTPYTIFIHMDIEDGRPKWSTRFPEKSDYEVLGQCPLCKGNVYENSKGYACENNKRENGTCRFILWKNDKFVTAVTTKPLSTSQVKSILKSGKCKAIAHKKDDPTKTYSIYLHMKYGEKYPEWRTEFIHKK